jgi:hypothetical protein
MNWDAIGAVAETTTSSRSAAPLSAIAVEAKADTRAHNGKKCRKFFHPEMNASTEKPASGPKSGNSNGENTKNLLSLIPVLSC